MMDDMILPFKHTEHSIGPALGFASDKSLFEYTSELNQKMFSESSNLSLSQAVEIVRNECLSNERTLRAICWQLLITVKSSKEAHR